MLSFGAPPCHFYCFVTLTICLILGVQSIPRVNNLGTLTENSQGRVRHEFSFSESKINIEKIVRKNNYFITNYEKIIDFNDEDKNAQIIGYYDFYNPSRINLFIFGKENKSKLMKLAEKISNETGLEVITSLSSEASEVLSKRQTKKFLRENSLEDKVKSAGSQVGPFEVVKESLITTGKVIKKTSEIVRAISHVYPGLTFAIPTLFRKAFKMEYDLSDNSDGFPYIVFTALGTCISSGITGMLASNHGYSKETALAFLASNAISGAYEIVKHSKNKLSERKKAELANYNREEVLRKVEQGDFSFLVRDNKFRSREEQQAKGNKRLYKILKPTFSSTLSANETYERLIKNGVANNNETAETIMDKIKGVEFPTLTNTSYYTFSISETTNSRGEKGYELDYRGIPGI